MKIFNCSTTLNRRIILVIFAISLFTVTYCEKLETIASFMSNYKLMKKANLKKAKDPNSTSATPPATPPANPSSDVRKTTEDLPDVPVYFQGWVKYFRYMENGGEKPKTFFKNTAFAKQSLGVTNSTATEVTDKYGDQKIPSEKHFFFVIYKDTANILTSRENPLMVVADSLIIDFVRTIPEDNNFIGGIKDFGKFSEGSCFEVETVKPGAFFQMSAQETEPSKGLKELWLICSDDDASKKQMMNILIKLKLKKQHSVGVYVSTSTKSKNSSLNLKNNIPTLSDFLNNNPNAAEASKINDPNRADIDGYWILLQDWTPCTLKCGGGLQYQQLMCVPPKKGGKQCEGEAVRTKPCNAQPCPQVQSLSALLPDSGKKKNSTKVEKAIIKVMPISSRPQRYDKCYLKETDALMIKNDKEYKDLENLPKIPIRLVMNNKSVTVYQDESLHTNMATFLLRSTSFSRVKNDPRCFILNGINVKAQFCQLDSQNGNFVEEWDYDFSLFKNQCHQKRETVEITKTEDKKLQEDYKSKLNNLKMEMVEKKSASVKKEVENNEEVKLEKKIEQTQAMTLMAIQKELKLEEMLEKEEAEKEKEEQMQLQVQIESEKKKSECLNKSIQEKQIEDQMNLTKANAEDAIQKIKEDAKKQIMVKRTDMKKRIQMMRNKNKRKMNQLQNEIINIRVETAGKVQRSAKVGNMANCFNPGYLQAAAIPKIEEYCTVNHSDNNAKFMECKNPESFCFICCETEFGELHLVEREKCVKTVCENESAQSAAFIIGHQE